MKFGQYYNYYVMLFQILLSSVKHTGRKDVWCW